MVCVVVSCLLAGSAAADLVGTVDYSDTFSIGVNGRTDGYYNADNGVDSKYNIEYSRFAPLTVQWTPTSALSFNTGSNTIAGHGWTASGNAGAAGGVAQSGGGEFGIAYGQRSNYVVQTDYATSEGTYFDVWSGDGSGNKTLYVLFRKGESAIGVGYVDSVTGGYAETSTGFLSGIAANDGSWHNTAVQFNKDANTLSLYVDRSLKGTVDLTILAGGAYKSYSTAYVGVGADKEDAGGLYVSWADNFNVGSASTPEPSTAHLVASGLFGVLVYAWRKRKQLS